MTRADFARKIGSKVWNKTEEIFNAIDAGERRIIIRSCNGAGKTNLLSTLVAYELDRADGWSDGREPESLVIICTGATWSQLHNSFWAEIKRAVRRAAIPLQKRTASELAKTERQTCIAIAPGKIESGQGYHADRIVIFCDEASGLSADMMQALESNATGENYLIVYTCNPLDTESAIHDMEERNQYKVFEISAFDHPNVVEGREVIKGAISREQVVRWLHRDTERCDSTVPDAIHVPWEDNMFFHPNPEVMARICGKYTLGGLHGFIPMSELLKCCAELLEVQSGEITLGVDVAASGDDRTAITIFKGNEQIAYDSIETGEYHIIAARIEQRCIDYDVRIIGIDDTGVGNAVTVRLKQSQVISERKIQVVAVNFANAPKGFERDRKPHNARAEMYMVLEGEIRRNEVKLLYKADALKEIAAARIVPSKGQSGTVRLEDKILIKRRLGRSPDYADAVALARYAPRILKYRQRPIFF